MRKRIRLTPEQRKREIVVKAVRAAIKYGLYRFSIVNVAGLMPDCSKATIKHYFTITALRNAVIVEALTRPDCDIILGHAVVMRDPLVNHLSEHISKIYTDYAARKSNV